MNFIALKTKENKSLYSSFFQFFIQFCFPLPLLCLCVSISALCAPELLRKRQHVVEKLQEFEETIDPIVQLFEDPEVQEYLEQKK